jgi:hypothetical protein
VAATVAAALAGTAAAAATAVATASAAVAAAWEQVGRFEVVCEQREGAVRVATAVGKRAAVVDGEASHPGRVRSLQRRSPSARRRRRGRNSSWKATGR